MISEKNGFTAYNEEGGYYIHGGRLSRRVTEDPDYLIGCYRGQRVERRAAMKWKRQISMHRRRQNTRHVTNWLAKFNNLVNKVTRKCTAEVAVFVVCSGFVGVLGMQQLADDLPALSVVGAGFLDTLTAVAFPRLVSVKIMHNVMLYECQKFCTAAASWVRQVLSWKNPLCEGFAKVLSRV